MPGEAMLPLGLTLICTETDGSSNTQRVAVDAETRLPARPASSNTRIRVEPAEPHHGVDFTVPHLDGNAAQAVATALPMEAHARCCGRGRCQGTIRRQWFQTPHHPLADRTIPIA